MDMYVGILEIRVKILDALNLKDKRKVIKSVFDRVNRKYQFSCGEISEQEIINLSIWGFSCVSNSYCFVEDRLDKLVDFLEDDYRFEIIDLRREIIKW